MEKSVKSPSNYMKARLQGKSPMEATRYAMRQAAGVRFIPARSTLEREGTKVGDTYACIIKCRDKKTKLIDIWDVRAMLARRFGIVGAVKVHRYFNILRKHHGITIERRDKGVYFVQTRSETEKLKNVFGDDYGTRVT